jgi:hypothetical protein
MSSIPFRRPLVGEWAFKSAERVEPLVAAVRPASARHRGFSPRTGTRPLCLLAAPRAARVSVVLVARVLFSARTECRDTHAGHPRSPGRRPRSSHRGRLTSDTMRASPTALSFAPIRIPHTDPKNRSHVGWYLHRRHRLFEARIEDAAPAVWICARQHKSQFS